MCVCSVCVCVCEGGREKSFIQETEKLWCGSCAVWMFRPSSAAGQDVSSFVRHPVFSEYVCVCVCVRERELYTRERKALVWVLCCLDVSSIVSSLSRCFVRYPVFSLFVCVRERKSFTQDVSYDV